MWLFCCFFFFFSSRRRHTRLVSDWSSDVCSSDLLTHARNGDHTALEERIVAPRSFEPGLIRSDRMRIEIADLFRMQPVGNVEDAQAADVVRLIHRVAYQPEGAGGRLARGPMLAPA